MRRGVVHAVAWAMATAAAVTLSWFGVRSVLRDTAFAPPRALPVVTQPPEISATQRPSPRPRVTARPTPSHPSPARSGTATPRTTAPASATPTATPPPPAAGDVHGYTLKGGRVVLDLGASSASLVSATPNSGWQMSVWRPSGGQWLRVTFTSASGTEASTVSCTWNGHPPAVQAYEN